MNMLQFGPLVLEYDSERGELYISTENEALGMVELPNEDMWSELVQWHRTRKRVEIVHEDIVSDDDCDACNGTTTGQFCRAHDWHNLH